MKVLIRDPLNYRKEVYQFLGKQSVNFTKEDLINHDGANWQSNTTQIKKLLSMSH